MDAKKILAELLQFGCIKEGREATTLSVLNMAVLVANAHVSVDEVIHHSVEYTKTVSAEDLDAVADEQKATDDTKGTVN